MIRDFSSAVIQPSKMYYINFHVTNTLDKAIELLSSDGQPAGGFHIEPKQVVKIGKELSFPTSVMFTAQDLSTGGDAIINGEQEYIATPSVYKQQMVAVIITPVGSSGKISPILCRIPNLHEKTKNCTVFQIKINNSKNERETVKGRKGKDKSTGKTLMPYWPKKFAL